MFKRVTIADVARAAGVSMMTVSRVINNTGSVSDETRQRVLDLIEELGYRPSGLARGLATQRTRTLGLVVTDVANPFFSGIATGVEQVAYERGYTVFLCNTEEDPAREMAVLRMLEDQHVDGLILCSPRLSDEELVGALARQKAAVLVNRRLPGNGVGTVVVDDITGGRMVTEHMLALGRQAVGFLAGPVASWSGRRRLAGFRQALEGAGRAYVEGWVQPCAPSAEGGLDAATALLRENEQIDALVCYNDLVAIGALQACERLHLNVPEDIAVAGFDDIALARLVSPPLTTAHVSHEAVGAQAVNLLLARIEGCEDACDEVSIKPTLIVRESAPNRNADDAEKR